MTEGLRSAEILFNEALKLGLSPKWVIASEVMTVIFNEKSHYLYYSYDGLYSYASLNSQLVSYLSRNKHMTRMLAEKEKLPNIPYLVSTSKEEIAAFLQNHEKIIAKPIMGGHSRGVYLMESLEILETISLREYIFEQYIKGSEYRYLVLSGEVIAVHYKKYPPPINNPERVERISYPYEQWNQVMVELALRTAASLGLQYAAVDFLIDEKGKEYILEVNSMPGLWRFHVPHSGLVVNVAEKLLKEMMRSWE